MSWWPQKPDVTSHDCISRRQDALPPLFFPGKRRLSKGAGLETTKWARLSALRAGLKRPERHHLQMIVRNQCVGLTAAVCERLISVGLVRRQGDSYLLTDDGREVARRL
jgi:hypothetical protein